MRGEGGRRPGEGRRYSCEFLNGLLSPIVFVNSKLEILLIEDDEDDALLMLRALHKAGIDHGIQVVSDGQEALDYVSGTGKFQNRSEYPLPSIVLLDLKLPKVPGLDVLKCLRETPATRAMIVIVLTSSNLPADISQAYELGANSYIVKPPAFEQLVAFARVFKQYWLDFNSFAPCNISSKAS
ncbi:MAG: response regulator [Verrucomicrobia bacterium]|nr:response regulator [Verrucomicrobiota bacterium]